MLRWTTLCLAVCLYCCSSPAWAAPCAAYLDQKIGYRLLFQPDGTVQEYNKDGIVQAVHQYYRAGQSVWLRNYESGYSQQYQFAGNGKQLKKSDSTWGDTLYIQQQRNSCPSLSKTGLSGKAGLQLWQGKGMLCSR